MDDGSKIPLLEIKHSITNNVVAYQMEEINKGGNFDHK